MPPTPDAGPALTESDFDALVDEELKDFTGTSTEDPGDSPSTGPSDDEGIQFDTGESPAKPAADDDTIVPEVPEPAPAAPAPDAAAPAAAAPVPAAPAPPASTTEPKPYQFKAMGAEHTLPGAFQLADGRVVIAAEAITDFNRVLASEKELKTNFHKHQRQSAVALEEAKREKSGEIAEATAMQEYMAKLLAMTPDERWETLQQLEADIPKLKVEVEKQELAKERARFAAEQKQLEDDRKGPQPTQEEMVANVRSAIQTEMVASHTRLKAEPDAKLLSDEEFNGVFDRWAKKPQKLMVKAEADIPAAGIKKGEWYYDETELIEDLNFLIGMKKRAAAAAPPAAPPVSPAAAKNAKLNADRPVNVIPPVVAPSAPPSGTPRKGLTKDMKRAEFKKKFMAGELDEP